jgi:hypothetical protein
MHADPKSSSLGNNIITETTPIVDRRNYWDIDDLRTPLSTSWIRGTIESQRSIDPIGQEGEHSTEILPCFLPAMPLFHKT